MAYLPARTHPPATAVQLSTARLLVEGHVDDDVARETGISVRTCRTHLDALLVRSGVAGTDRSGHAAGGRLNTPAACENSPRQP